MCCATFRLFKVGDDYNLSDLKKLVVHFGLVWNFVASRTGSTCRCNRYTRLGSSVRKVILRRTSHIVCGCEWCIRFSWVVAGKCTGIDYVKITYMSGSHTNTCDLSGADQFVLTRTRASLTRSVQIMSYPRLWFEWVVLIVLMFNLWWRF